MTLTGRDPLDRPDHPLYVPDDHERDPFGAFDRAAGVGDVADPYTPFETLRARCPVHPSGGLAAVMGEEPDFDPNTLLSDKPPVTVYGFDAVRRVLGDGATFSSSGYANSIGLVFGHSILEMDEPEHGRTATSSSRPSPARRWSAGSRTIVAPDRRRPSTASPTRGHADLVRELTLPFPDPGDRRHARPAASGPAAVPPPGGRGHLDHRRHRDRGCESSAQARATTSPASSPNAPPGPRDDVISRAGPRRGAERRRSPAPDRRGHLRLPPPAAAGRRRDDVPLLVSNLALRPARRTPTSSTPCGATARLMPQAIEEGLRWEPPLTGIARLALRDAEVDGVRSRPPPVSVCLGSANRDPRAGSTPRLRHLPRAQAAHGLRFGAHICLGMHLARMETRVVAERRARPPAQPAPRPRPRPTCT